MSKENMMTDKAIEAAAISWMGRESWDELDPAGKFVCLEDARAAIEAYEAVKWQPIETAPKDKTVVRVKSHGREFIAYFDFEYSNGRRVYKSAIDCTYNIQPDSWQPLPTLPQTSGGDDA